MSLTPSIPDSLQLTSGEVHSWCVSLDVSLEACARLAANLTADERSRCARLRFERDRRRFGAARGVLRDLLARYLSVHPSELRFAYHPLGKPRLEPEFGDRLRFNLSHSVDLALIGIAADADIGVDVEHVGTRVDHVAIARHFFSRAEAEHLNGLPSHLQAQAFFRSWTKREAYLKACGAGLTGMEGESQDGLSARHWSLYTLQPVPGYVGAVAVEGGGWRLTQRHWQMH